jgi:hypothetical protein
LFLLAWWEDNLWEKLKDVLSNFLCVIESIVSLNNYAIEFESVFSFNECVFYAQISQKSYVMYPVSETNSNSICFPCIENISGLHEKCVLHVCKNGCIELFFKFLNFFMIHTKERKA